MCSDRRSSRSINEEAIETTGKSEEETSLPTESHVLMNNLESMIWCFCLSSISLVLSRLIGLIEYRTTDYSFPRKRKRTMHVFLYTYGSSRLKCHRSFLHQNVRTHAPLFAEKTSTEESTKRLLAISFSLSRWLALAQWRFLYSGSPWI